MFKQLNLRAPTRLPFFNKPRALRPAAVRPDRTIQTRQSHQQGVIYFWSTAHLLGRCWTLWSILMIWWDCNISLISNSNTIKEKSASFEAANGSTCSCLATRGASSLACKSWGVEGRCQLGARKQCSRRKFPHRTFTGFLSLVSEVNGHQYHSVKWKQDFRLQSIIDIMISISGFLGRPWVKTTFFHTNQERLEDKIDKLL